MNFHTLQNAPIQRGDLVCRQSRLKAGTPVVVMAGLAAGCLWLGLEGGVHTSTWIVSAGLAYYIGAVLGLFALLFTLPLRACFDPANWIMHGTATGLVIKYRSYLNRKLPAEDVQVVSFDFPEIAWVRIVKETQRLPESLSRSDEGLTTRFLTYLEFQLVNHDTRFLEHYLQEERNGQEPGGGARWRDFPMMVMGDGVVRVHWNDITPNATQTLQWLSRSAQVLSEVHTKIDFDELKTRSMKEQEAAILRVAQGGNNFAAHTMSLLLFDRR